ncbi:MAG: hypothetical protein Q9228_002258 [Teloschistes exilis]
MSASASSNLTAPSYGYDFVVATTQASINATMLDYINGLKSTPTTRCFVNGPKVNGKKTTVEMAYEDLLKKTGGVDPFGIADGTSFERDDGSNLEKVAKAGFLACFRITMGIPPGLVSTPEKVPNVVVLGNNTKTVTYNMLCSKFQIAELQYDYDGATLVNLNQPKAGWIIKSHVDLRLDPVGDAAYNKLPPAVQASVKNLGADAFGVQQLLFDLNQAGLSDVPEIPGLLPNSAAKNILTQYFINTYFQDLKTKGQPVLNYTIVKHNNPATLIPTDLNMMVQPLIDPTTHQPYAKPSDAQADLATLDYLCACYNKILKPAVPFTWDWMNTQDAKQYHGIISVNRNTFAGYIRDQLMPSIPKNCLIPTATITMKDLGTKKEYAAHVSSGGVAAFSMPAAGANVLTLHYEQQADDYAGSNDLEGEIHLKPSLDVNVYFQNDNIVITQHLNIYLKVRSLQTTVSGNIIDYTLKDTYYLGVDKDGKITVNASHEPLVDHSETPGTDAFVNLFTGINGIVSYVKNQVSFTSTTFQSFPISVVQNFVFPGGKTFAFKKVAFSNFQDLTSAITYAQATNK